MTRSIAAVAATLEELWQAIREQHSEVPDVILVPGASGSRNGKVRLWGHFWPGRWAASATRLPEVMVSGEGFDRGAAEILGTVLHEAAHALGWARKLKDTSNSGRYHNAVYAGLAFEVGLSVGERVRIYGLSETSVPPETAALYAPHIKRLGELLTFSRVAESGDPGDEEGKGESSAKNGLVLICPSCGRRLRLSPTSFEAGPIVCLPCRAEFQPKEEDE